MNRNFNDSMEALLEWDCVPSNGKVKVSAYRAYSLLVRKLEKLKEADLIKLDYANPDENYDLHYVSIKWLPATFDFDVIDYERVVLLADLFKVMDSFAMPDEESNEWFFTIRIYYDKEEVEEEVYGNGLYII